MSEFQPKTTELGDDLCCTLMYPLVICLQLTTREAERKRDEANREVSILRTE